MSTEEIIQCAKDGHSLLILGQAGTGKSRLLHQIYNALNTPNYAVKMTATTGIAASQLQFGMTIHKFCGLMDGRYSDLELLTKITLDDDLFCKARNNMMKTDHRPLNSNI
jgi:ABC-type lipoprotein export system ATPase subunit